MTPRSDEAHAFFDAITDADPRAVSACEGWTTHEIAAHVTGIAVEVIRHLEPYQSGDAVQATRSFEEREAPLQAMDHDALLARMDHEEQRMRALVDEVVEAEPDAVIPWTGTCGWRRSCRTCRNGHTLHGWDVAGEDERGEELLGRAELVEHSVGEVGRILLVAGRTHDPRPDEDLHVQLRADPEPTLLMRVRSGEAGLEWATDADSGPAVEMDPAARHLLIWGRRPDRHGHIRSRLDRPAATPAGPALRLLTEEQRHRSGRVLDTKAATTSRSQMSPDHRLAASLRPASRKHSILTVTCHCRRRRSQHRSSGVTGH